MKKLMFAAAVAATCGAFAEIASDNTVGYETRNLTAFAQVINGANFVTVGQNTLSLQSITMDSTVTDGDAQIWWWNGSTYDAQAFWYTDLYADESGNTTLGYAGWGDFDYWMPINKTFEKGQGFWIKCGVNAAVMFPNPFYVAP